MPTRPMRLRLPYCDGVIRPSIMQCFLLSPLPSSPHLVKRSRQMETCRECQCVVVELFVRSCSSGAVLIYLCIARLPRYMCKLDFLETNVSTIPTFLIGAKTVEKLLPLTWRFLVSELWGDRFAELRSLGSPPNP